MSTDAEAGRGPSCAGDSMCPTCSPPDEGRQTTVFLRRCVGCGAAVTVWDDEFGYAWNERGFATCGESDTAHHLPVECQHRWTRGLLAPARCTSCGVRRA